MGIIINDTLSLANGLTVTDAYASFHKQTIQFFRHFTPETSTEGWMLMGVYNIWTNQIIAKEGGPSLQQNVISVMMTDAQLELSPFKILYNEMKTMYTNTTDC